ncbi:MFS transporter [Microbacterium sp.]|uniref:MFS transporter n=1 Tax=Microbacterium sp. TaxID=51671 RepID=UPI003341D23D
MSEPTTSEAPRLLRTPPPFGRDRMVHAWIGVIGLANAGDAIWSIALSWTAVQIASPAVAGLVVAAGAVPRAAILLFGGALADRADARRVMILFNALRILVLVGTAGWVLAHPPTVPMLAIAAVAFGVCDALYSPSAATLSRQLVRTEDLPRYGAAAQVSWRLGTMGGAAVGGFLVAHSGLAGGAAVDTITFALLIAFLAIWLRPRFALPRTEREPVLRGIGKGFAHLRAAALTRTLILSLLGLNLAVGPAVGIGIALRATAEGWGAGAVGLFEGLLAAGAALGSLSVLRLRPRREARAGFIALMVQGLCIVMLGLGPAWVTGTASLVLGVTAGFASVMLGSTFTAMVDAAYLGRMSAITQLGDDCLMPAAMALFGALATIAPLWVAFAVFGGGMILMMLVPLRNPRIRALSLRAGSGPSDS